MLDTLLVKGFGPPQCFQLFIEVQVDQVQMVQRWVVNSQRLKKGKTMYIIHNYTQRPSSGNPKFKASNWLRPASWLKIPMSRVMSRHSAHWSCSSRTSRTNTIWIHCVLEYTLLNESRQSTVRQSCVFAVGRFIHRHLLQAHTHLAL